jgi:pimeloyl-ACP methyl ester carboxylesterase
MGGWMALLLARDIAKRPSSRASLAGLVLIAPAPDFTEALMWNNFSPEVKQEIESKGVWLRPSEYGEPYPMPCLRGGAIISARRRIDVGRPVRILQGAQDPTCRGSMPSRRTGCQPMTWY